MKLFGFLTKIFGCHKTGHHDIMIDGVPDSKWAYKWVNDIGDHDIMIDKIPESQHAYHWILNNDNQNIPIVKNSDPTYDYKWRLYFGNRDTKDELPKMAKINIHHPLSFF